MGSTGHTIFRQLTIIAALLVHAGAAAAQDVAPPAIGSEPHPLGQLRLGTLSLAPTFKISNLGFDTNVFDLSGVERQPPDFTATVEPGAEIRVTTNRLAIRTLTRASFVYYQKYKTEQAFNPSVDVQVENRLSSRLALYAKGTYGFSKERTGFEIDSRQRVLTEWTSAGLRIGEQRKLQLDLHGAYSTVAYDRSAMFLDVNLAQNLDHSTTSAGANLGYALSPYTTLTLVAEEVVDRFTFSPDRDLHSFAVFTGVRFNPHAVISGEASVGYRRVDPQSPRTPSFSGVTPRAGLTYRLRDIFSVGVGAERGVENSFQVDRPYFVYMLYEGSVRQVLFHHLDIGGSLQYTTLAYRTFLDVAPSSVPSPDILRMGSVNLGVPITRRIRFGVYVQRWERLSAERPYSTNRSGIEMTVGRASLTSRGVFLAGPAR
jgi:hypothetical protein